MAPNEVQTQTYKIIECLFDDEPEIQDRDLIESDSVVPDGDSFDPVIIADKLRELGDHYEETVIQPLLKKLQDTPENEVASTFDEGVDFLCNTLSSQGLGPEMHLLRATIILGMGVKRKLPNLVGAVQSAMANLLNRRLEQWIQQRGGWEHVPSDE